MQRIPISSSCLTSVGYDETRFILEVEFNTGEVYEYLDVPHEVYIDLINSNSIGYFFNKNIKTNYSFS